MTPLEMTSMRRNLSKSRSLIHSRRHSPVDLKIKITPTRRSRKRYIMMCLRYKHGVSCLQLACPQPSLAAGALPLAPSLTCATIQLCALAIFSSNSWLSEGACSYHSSPA